LSENSKKTANLITHYFNNEADHIPILVTFLENEAQRNEEVLFSNLFNFKADFDKNEVIIEDQCGLFLASNPEGSQKTAISKFLRLCKKRMNEK
jgi:vesicle coat complex subunit